MKMFAKNIKQIKIDMMMALDEELPFILQGTLMSEPNMMAIHPTFIMAIFQMIQ